MPLVIVHLQPIRNLYSKIANAGYRCIFFVLRHNGRTKVGGESPPTLTLLEKTVEGDGAQNGLHQRLPVLGTPQKGSCPDKLSCQVRNKGCPNRNSLQECKVIKPPC